MKIGKRAIKAKMLLFLNFLSLIGFYLLVLFFFVCFLGNAALLRRAEKERPGKPNKVVQFRKISSYSQKGFFDSLCIESLRQLVWRPFPKRKRSGRRGVKRRKQEKKSIKAKTSFKN
ncbi:MAG: hypothetical protein RBR26_02340 [Methanosarcina mazei]|nr:hypothetical protein [Methanosarcina mazei]